LPYSRLLFVVSVAHAALACTTGVAPPPDIDAAFADVAPPDTGPPPPPPPPGCDAEDACGDGIDNDCDDVIEEGCPCVPGEVAQCFHGRPENRYLGQCADGMMTCTDGLEFGTWGECVGDTTPSEEACDVAELDEDCDGSANEGCECTGAEPLPCGTDVGTCVGGLQPCVDGLRGECADSTGPGLERCNAEDDDCDGSIDERRQRRCGESEGACTLGVETCVDGEYQGCTGVLPVDEVCDGIDNDCDLSIDEEVPARDCGSALGECAAGTQSCELGTWSMCAGATSGVLEECNGLDDDCDGSTDEMLSRDCGSSVGVCRPGTQTCAAGSYGVCGGGVVAGTEACEGTLDEDCDGTVDEGCGCSAGAMRACGTATGACRRGTQTCDSGGSWGPCAGGTDPMLETCNMADDDCDGSTDEGGICTTVPPVIACGADVTDDVLATVTISGSASDPDGGAVTYAWTVTSRPTGSTSTPTSPTSPTTTFYLDASGTYELELCATDDEGDSACCTVTVTSRPPGAIHVELSWDTAYGDADVQLLNVTRTPPDGWYTTDDCHWLNMTPDWGPVGPAGNPQLDIDDTDGYGPENITIDTAPVPGRYHAAAHYYCSSSIGDSVAPGDGPTTATMRIFCSGSLVATYTGITLNRSGDFVNVAAIDYPSCAVTDVLDYTNDSSVLPPSLTVERHCELPCTTDADCPPMEVCAEVVGGGRPRYICLLDRP